MTSVVWVALSIGVMPAEAGTQCTEQQGKPQFEKVLSHTAAIAVLRPTPIARAALIPGRLSCAYDARVAACDGTRSALRPSRGSGRRLEGELNGRLEVQEARGNR
jgi:hypothetical protein